MKYVLLTSLVFLTSWVNAQGNWTGKIVDTKGNGIPQASVALLEANDSTVAYFALSNNDGVVQFKGCTPKIYVLNCSAFGYVAQFVTVDLSSPSIAPQLIVLKEEGTTLNAVDVVGERSPITFKKDTIEYNASSFKTKPDAVVEDLLKKLPGVEVDAQGNIKAQGNKVEKIKIDGKEFFSNDPALVSKNVPADAVKKVQVVEDKTDEERFSGVDDGTKNTSINLVLKDDKKNIWFGSLGGGLGQGKQTQFDVNARLFQFKPNRQLAFLGMSNSINKFGFSFQDYIEFNGGLQRFMDEAGRIEFDGNEFPIDFGQPLFGNYTTGVGAVNVSFNPKKGINHLFTGLGSSKTQALRQDKTTTFFQSIGDLTQNEERNSRNVQQNNALNYSYKNQEDTSKLVTAQAGIRFSHKRDRNFVQRLDEFLTTKVNQVAGDNRLVGEQMGINGSVSVQKKLKSTRIQLVKLRASTDYTPDQSHNAFLSAIQTYATGSRLDQIYDQRMQSNRLKNGLSFSAVRKLNEKTMLDVGVSSSDLRTMEDVNQQEWSGKFRRIDSLSGRASLSYSMFQPTVQLRKQGKKWSGSLRLKVEQGQLTTRSKGTTELRSIQSLLPEVQFNYEFSKTNRIQLDANRDLVLPTIEQINPIQQSTNVLFSSKGNLSLLPEKQHKMQLNWNFYDNFSFMSLFAGFDFTYTKDKIALSRTIASNAVQRLSYVNVPEDYIFRGFVDWSTPIRKLGIIFHLGVTESFGKGYSLINLNLQRTLSADHSYEVRIENRKKARFDASVGSRLTMNTTTVISNASFNTSYQKLAYFGNLDYTVKDKWNFGVELSSNQYTGTTLRQTVIVPLLQLEASRYLGKTKRHLLTVSAFDVLNKNVGIQQVAQLNFSSTSLSNVLQQYVMLKYTYRINKSSTEANGVSIQTKVR